MNRIDVGKDFYHRLANRDQRQGDGKHNATQFREKYLLGLDNTDAWRDDSPFILFDFENVKIIGPSFANEAFGYFTVYASQERILNKIRFENLSTVQKSIIETELTAGYSR